MYLTCQVANGTKYFATAEAAYLEFKFNENLHIADIGVTSIAIASLTNNHNYPNNTANLTVHMFGGACQEGRDMECGLSKNGVELIPKQLGQFGIGDTVFEFNIAGFNLLVGDTVTFNCITHSKKNIIINQFLLYNELYLHL